MSETAPDLRPEAVQGQVEGDLADALVHFWTSHGALSRDAARARLPEVVCVLRDASGAIAGASSAYVADVEAIGGRRFFVFRGFVPDGDPIALVAPTYGALAAGFDAAPDAPVGLCVPLSAEDAARHPEARWTDPPLVHAAALADGGHLRVAYFDRASIVPGRPAGPVGAWDLESGPRIVAFAAQSEIGPDAVVDFWLREGALPEAEARRRADEVYAVALDDGGALVGLSTTYLQHSEQLRLDMWFHRVFVGAAHRRAATALRLLVFGRTTLGERFRDGVDTRAPGVVVEVENEGLKLHTPEAHWFESDFTFVGENARGDHVRVHWFPGARVPA